MLRSFNFTLKNRFFQHQYRKQEKCLFLLHGWFPIKFLFTYNISLLWLEINFRSSHWRCSVKKDVLKNFAKSTGKQLCQSLFFNKVTGLRSATLLKKRLWHRCFAVNFARPLRTPFERNTSGRVLLWMTTSKTLNTKYLELKSKEDQKFQKRICHVNVL